MNQNFDCERKTLEQRRILPLVVQMVTVLLTQDVSQYLIHRKGWQITLDGGTNQQTRVHVGGGLVGVVLEVL